MTEKIAERKRGLEVAEVFSRGMAAYAKNHGPLPPAHWKVVNALERCRTAAMGGHSYKCGNCDYEKQVYNSCRNRHCPKCQGLARLKWVQARMEELLPVEYFHVVLTMPAELNAFALRNKAAFYDLLQKSVADTLLSLSRDPKRLGAEIGFISVLHTWGQNMMDHPHVHCIVPAGGLEDGVRWKSLKGKFLFPFKVMSSLFKGKMLSGFKRAVEKGDIRFHGHLEQYTDPARWKAYLDGLYAKNWVAYCKPPFAGAGQVLKYLGGYTHRMAISNHRIVSIDENTVRFRWRSYADGGKTKVMTLAHKEFIRRFLLHVLPKGFQRIRYYGFLANCKRKKALGRCREILSAKVKDPAPEKDMSSEKAGQCDLVSLFKSVFHIDLTFCPKCRNRTVSPTFPPAHVRYSRGVFR